MTSTAICDLLAETETRSVAGAAGHCTLVILLPIDSSNDVCVDNECRVLEVAVKLHLARPLRKRADGLASRCRPLKRQRVLHGTKERRLGYKKPPDFKIMNGFPSIRTALVL